MKRRQLESLQMNRRQLLVLASAAVTACGGGDGGTAGVPGTGGTGVYAQGAISGFGSVIVNGVKYDDTLASANGSITVDGVQAASADLRLGMVAAVEGVVDAVNQVGTASRIDIWSVAQGRVTAVGPQQITVAGNLIQTGSTTLVDGISSVAALKVGDRVTVWGLQTDTAGVQWSATRMALAHSDAVVSTGRVIADDERLSVNGWELSGALAERLSAGQLVRVQGVAQESRNRLELQMVKVLDLDYSVMPAGEVKMEGIVAAIADGGKIMLGTIAVDVSRASFVPAGFALSVGSRVEVYGVWSGGVLKANILELEEELVLRSLSISARIEKYNSLANFVLRGQTCDATAAVFEDGSAAELRVGVKVKVHGYNTGGNVLHVTRLEFD